MRILSAAVLLLLATACQRETAPAPSPETAAAKADAASQAPASQPDAAAAQKSEPGTVPVNVDNFVRAESDLFIANAVKEAGGTGKFFHRRELTPIDKQTVIRINRDTLYSAAVVDLDAGPATITLPDAGKRFMSMQLINEDQYTPQVIYKSGRHTLSRDTIGTRYVLVGVRTLADPNNPDDMKQAHALQDAIKLEQAGPGVWEAPKWDPVTQKQVREALLALAAGLPDTRKSFGTKADVDPVRRLVNSAAAWGGNPDKDALYLNVTPAKNDGKTVYKLHVGEVPVDGFWSISVYNAKGYYEANDRNAYTINNLTAKHNDDGSVDVQFGGCDGQVPNCLPTASGWNYLVRLYRPRAEALSGKWTFPEAQPAG
jgi:hypothetical protein